MFSCQDISAKSILRRGKPSSTVSRHANTFAFNCVCKCTLEPVRVTLHETRNFDGQMSDVKNNSREHVTSAYVCTCKKPDVMTIKVEVSFLIFALLTGQFSLSPRWTTRKPKFSLRTVTDALSYAYIAKKKKKSNNTANICDIIRVGLLIRLLLFRFRERDLSMNMFDQLHIWVLLEIVIVILHNSTAIHNSSIIHACNRE